MCICLSAIISPELQVDLHQILVHVTYGSWLVPPLVVYLLGSANMHPIYHMVPGLTPVCQHTASRYVHPLYQCSRSCSTTDRHHAACSNSLRSMLCKQCGQITSRACYISCYWLRSHAVRKCGFFLYMSHMAWSDACVLPVLGTRVSCAQRLNRCRCCWQQTGHSRRPEEP